MSLGRYGAWGFLGQRTVHLLTPRIAIFFSALGSLIIGVACLYSIHFKFQCSASGITYGALTGAATALGTIFFIAALQKGPSIPVVMITALYPMITIFLLYIFDHTHLSTYQVIGVILSLIALVLLNIP